MHLDTTSLIFSLYKQQGPRVLKPRARRRLTLEVLSLSSSFTSSEVQTDKFRLKSERLHREE